MSYDEYMIRSGAIKEQVWSYSTVQSQDGHLATRWHWGGYR